MRGALLIAIAVLVGVVLLGQGFDSGFLPSDDGGTDVVTDDSGEDDPDDGDASETTTVQTPVTHAPQGVRVQVLNGGGPSGSAAAATTTLGTAGFVTVDASDTADIPATAVLYAEGFQADAQVVAATISSSAQPQPMGDAPPAPIEPGAVDVVVILGPDYTG